MTNNRRLANTLENARWTLLFNMVLLVVNFVSRRVFIESLGNDFLGLSASVTSFVGFLSLAELGVTTALIQALYKPIADRDRAKIEEIASVLAFLFRWVGVLIGVAGVILAFFLPSIFSDEGVSLGQIYGAFFVVLISTMLSYLVNYKQVVLLAAQRNYIVTKITNSVLVIKYLLQIGLLYLLGLGWEAWLIVELLSSGLYAWWLESKIRREFPQLRSSYGFGRRSLRKNGAILRNARNIFGQNIAGRVLISSDNIVVLNIMGAAQVTFFTNYTMLMQRITSILVGTLSATSSGVGHLVASGSWWKIDLVYRQLLALYFWLGSLVGFGFFCCVNPLINVWLEDVAHEIFSPWVVGLLSANLFIGIAARPWEYFLGAYGLFRDVWAAWLQMFINLGLSIWLTIEYGIVGVVVGTTISTALYNFVWRSYYLSSCGFKTTPWRSWWIVARYLVVIALSCGVTHWLLRVIDFRCGGILSVVIYAVIVGTLYAVVSGALFYLSDRGSRSLAKVGYGIVKRLTVRFAKKIKK